MEDNFITKLGPVLRLIFKVLVPCLFFSAANAVSASHLENKDGNMGKYILNAGTPSAARITDLNAILKDGEYEISWGTVYENNIRQYDIEYSYDNKNFQRAGVLSANDKSVYSFNHLTAPRQNMYYRVKIVEANGNFEYSKTITVTMPGEKAEDYVMPTIVRDGVLSIVLNKAYKNMTVFNAGGDQVFLQNIGERTGRLTFTLPALPAGQYFIRLIAKDTAITRRVMLQ
jgi:hypothetical protein